MSARKRAGNAGTSSPAVTRTYKLRDRTIHVLGQSSDTGIASPTTEPQTPEKRDRPVQPTARTKAPEITTKQIESDHDEDDSDDGSKHSVSSRSSLSERDTQSHIFSASSSSKSSQKIQPSQPRQPAAYSTAPAWSILQRPPIRNSIDDEGKMNITNTETWRSTDKKFQTSHYKEESRSWRSTEATKTQHPPSTASVSDDDEDEKRYGFPQEKETTKIQPVLPKPHVALPDDRGKESVVYRRPYQPKPREATQIHHAPSAASVSFSDDEEDKIFGQKKVTFSRQHAEGNKINHHPPKSDGRKVLAPTRPFICFSGRCIKLFLLLLVLVLLIGSAAVVFFLPESIHKIASQMKFIQGPQNKKDLKGEFVQLASNFSDQSEEMWRRSRIILERHLQSGKESSEPAIILLTGARDAEETLRCLGTRLADVFSSSLSGGYTVISGSDYASGSDEEVKEKIDDQLSAGFRSTSRAAVLHRLELLPAGSLLILYKYCDHESAMFKDVALLLTVLLDDPTLEKDIPLMNLEEKVRSFLIEKLINVDAKASHNGMDEDKFSGVWSRISHVVLPVFPEKNIIEKCTKKQN